MVITMQLISDLAYISPYLCASFCYGLQEKQECLSKIVSGLDTDRAEQSFFFAREFLYAWQSRCIRAWCYSQIISLGTFDSPSRSVGYIEEGQCFYTQKPFVYYPLLSLSGVAENLLTKVWFSLFTLLHWGPPMIT